MDKPFIISVGGEAARGKKEAARKIIEELDVTATHRKITEDGYEIYEPEDISIRAMVEKSQREYDERKYQQKKSRNLKVKKEQQKKSKKAMQKKSKKRNRRK